MTDGTGTPWSEPDAREPGRRRRCSQSMAIGKVKWPAIADWRQILKRTWQESGDDRAGLLAAGVAFYAFLAFVPLLASVVLTYGLVADPETVAAHIQSLARNLPEQAAGIIGDQLRSMTGGDDSAKGFGLLLAILFSVYGASKGAGAVITALNVAYDIEEARGFVSRTLVTLGMTLGAVLVLLVAALAISALGFIASLMPFTSPLLHQVLKFAFWGAAAVAASLVVAFVYRHGPNRPDAPWTWITPGSALATLLWLLATFGFGLYVSNFGNYNATYGSLGGVVVFLTWLYLSAYILLMGAELNAELERQQSRAPAKGAAGPAGESAAGEAAPRPRPVATEEPAQPTAAANAFGEAGRARRAPPLGAIAAGGAALLGIAALRRRRRAGEGPVLYRGPGAGGAARA